MAVAFDKFFDLETGCEFDAENGSLHDLIWLLRFSFRDSDFAKVESILMQREAKLKQEMKRTEKENERLMEKLESAGVEKLALEEKLKKYQSVCWELQQLTSQLSQSKKGFHEKEGEVDGEVENWKRKYEHLESGILKLEEGTKLLSVEHNVKVSAENCNDVEVENGQADGGRSSDDGEKPPCRRIVEIIDSDDDYTIEKILTGNKMNSSRVPNSAWTGLTAVQSETGALKRKLNSLKNGSESKKSFDYGDDVKNVVDNSPTADYKKEKVQKFIHEHDCFSNSHSTKVAVSPKNNNASKFCIPSSEEPVILRRCGEKIGERISQILKEGLPLDLPVFRDIEDSSSSSSVSSDLDINFDDVCHLIKNQDGKKWESEADMLAAFEKDNELYLGAVCSLYRQRRKSSNSLLSSYNQGLDHFDALRGTTLAEFLLDGDLEGKPTKSVPQLLQYDEKGLDDCKKIAFKHSRLLFEIYQRKEDPLFLS